MRHSFLVFACSLTACSSMSGRAPAGFAVLARDSSNPFGAQTKPGAGTPRIVGSYAAGCVDGAAALPLTGPGYAIMHSERNRMYGHPLLLDVLKRAGNALGGDNPLLFGDLGQPRGGPMLSGHTSHQVGLDADIWLYAPSRDAVLGDLSAVSVLQPDLAHLDEKLWKPIYEKQLLWFAAQPEVDRIFVNVAIKRRMCEAYPGDMRLMKLRPWFLHDDHFHVRLKCPEGQPECVPQRPPDATECEEDKLAFWTSEKVLEQARHPPEDKPRTVDLPPACQDIVGK